MNLLRRLGNTKDIEKIALAVVGIAGKAAADAELRASLLNLANKARKWRPSTKIDKLNRKLRAIHDYADDVRDQFPGAEGPDEWTLRARNLGSRAKLAQGLSGKARKLEMIGVWQATDDLLRGALARTAELLEASETTAVGQADEPPAELEAEPRPD